MNTRSPQSKPALTMQLIREAHERIRGKIHRTPVMTSRVLDGMAGSRLYFKCENLQKAGAFKARGATNAVFLLTDAEAAKGVVTHSSGNHAAALARAAKLRGVPAYIVMPNNAPKAKQASVSRYGGNIIFCEPTLAAREITVTRLVAEAGAALIHPYNNLQVMAGQGTTGVNAMRLIWEVMKIVIEPSGAVPLAAILEERLDIKGKRVGLILTGGNLDLDRLPWQ